MNKEQILSGASEAIVAATNALLGDFDHLPDSAATDGQRALEAKHGTPKAFSQAVCKSIGTISVDEARTAIIRYVEEWAKA